MSQRDIANALGVTHGRIGQWESHRKSPGREVLQRLAEVTLTNIEALLRDDAALTPVLVQNPRCIRLLRGFLLMSERKQENLLELVDMVANIAGGSEEARHPAQQKSSRRKTRKPTVR